MRCEDKVLFGAAASVALFALQYHGAAAAAAAAASPGGASAVTEVIVTAQKRQENIQNVGMSIQAASGDKLTKLGVTDTASLQKIVPGFVSTPTPTGTVVFTIRGVGFQDTSLASSPTVTVYLDEAPVPFAALTKGATMDLQRVEVLKGPQGTLFGNNATGGAINYIANKPTDTFQAGADLTYGRFSDTNVQGFVSGPIAEGLDARIALQSHTSGAWQQGYGPQAGESIGGQDFLNGRVALQWKPNDKFKALLTLNGWQDKSYNQEAQLYGFAPAGGNPLAPEILAYPFAPHNDQSAGWMSCVNTSIYNPIVGQDLGATHLTPNGVPLSEGAGSAAQAGSPPSHCIPPRNNNTYYSGTLRIDYELPDDMTVTSLTEYQKFNRVSGVDETGIPFEDFQSLQSGKVSDVYEELRIAGKFAGKGNWIVGANYESSSSWGGFLQDYLASADAPTAIPFAGLCGTFATSYHYTCTPSQNPASPSHNSALYPAVLEDTLGPTEPQSRLSTTTYAVYASGEYPILENLSLLGGVRFTDESQIRYGCGSDGGDDTWSEVARQISNLLEVLNETITPATYLAGGGSGINAGPGGCATTGPAPLYQSLVSLSRGTLAENNVAWRAGLNWKAVPNTLLYVNVSQGFKAGSFPTIAASTYSELVPVHQESLLSYEAGLKSTLFDRQVTIDGAGFYYDYHDKQILGDINDPIFGPLAALVNIPQSHVVGFELAAVWTPDAIEGLTITPAVSYQQSRIDSCSASESPNCIGGHFHGYDQFGNYADLNGESFPSAPEWQASLDAEYDWKLRDDITASVGVNVNYISQTNTWLTDPTPPPGVVTDPLKVPGYTLVDLRAGISRDAWRFELWGHNVTNAYYWTAANHVIDTVVRYAGMPATYGFTLSYRYQ